MTVGRSGSASAPAGGGRLRSLASIVIFDVVGPLVAYYSLLSVGLPTVAALILSGALPATGIALGVARHRRPDAIGVIVLTGIFAGTVLWLAGGSARLVLLDGTVPTAVFGLVCLGSLRARRPLIYRFALESIGADTAKGRDFADRWRYPEFRHAFRVTTAVWGTALLAEAAAQAVIIQTTSAAAAKTTSNAMPLVVGGLVVVWNISYARRGQRRRSPRTTTASPRPCRPAPAMPTYRAAEHRGVVADDGGEQHSVEAIQRSAVSAEDRAAAGRAQTPVAARRAPERRDDATPRGLRAVPTAAPPRRSSRRPR